MNKLKFVVIALLILLFSLFIGIQVNEYGSASFAAAFFMTLIFSVFVFFIQVEYYIYAVKHFVGAGDGNAEDFQHPLDIWLIALPFTVLMIITYVLLSWHVAEVFYCTTLALTGMLFGNGLGRGSKHWSVRRSLPFFFGVIASTIYSFILGAMM